MHYYIIKVWFSFDTMTKGYGMENNRLLFYHYKPIIMYAVAGTLSTLVNWITYASCTHILPIASRHALVTTSNVTAWGITLAFSYLFYKNWVFESKTNTAHELFREIASFTGTRIITGLIEIFGFPFLVALGMNHTVAGITGFAAKIWITVIVTIVNYIMSKVFVFKNTNNI